MGKGWKAAKKKTTSAMAMLAKKSGRGRRNAKLGKGVDFVKKPTSWEDWPGGSGMYRKERITNDGFGQQFDGNGRPQQAAMVFGSILNKLPAEALDGMRLFQPTRRKFRLLADGRQIKKKTKEQLAYEKYNTDKQGYSMDTNHYHVTTDLKIKLKKLYDPTGKGRGELYTLKNLCKRESMKFDSEVRKWLNLLWGAVDDGEYQLGTFPLAFPWIFSATGLIVNMFPITDLTRYLVIPKI